MTKNELRKHGIVNKIVNQILWHPLWLENAPVKIQISTTTSRPFVSFGRFVIFVHIPAEFGECLPIVERAIKNLRAIYGNGKYQKPKVQRKPKVGSFSDVVFLTRRQVVKPMDEFDVQHDDNKNGSSTPVPSNSSNRTNKQVCEKSASTLSVVCHKCKRQINLPSEWLSLTIRCFTCGTFLSEVAEPKVR